MKTILIAVAAFVVGSQLAFADGAAEHKGHKKDAACAAIAKACGDAGFKPGAHADGKGLWLDCVDKVVAGTAVEGVTVTATAEELTACSAERKEMEAHAKKEHHGKGPEGHEQHASEGGEANHAE